MDKMYTGKYSLRNYSGNYTQIEHERSLDDYV
jgi:hypothetical protein